MKITRIPKIKNHRVFGDFSWKQDLHDFGTLNLIFGWNGSGKTTLSNLFRHIEKRQAVAEGEVQFLIEKNTVSGASLASDPGLPAVRVFNRDFILANVFSSQSDDIAPIFFLGEDSIEKQKQIEVLKKELTAKRSEFVGKQRELKDISADLESFCTQQAKSIKELLSSSGQNSYNFYDKRAFKAKCEELLRGDPKSKLLSDVQKNELKRKKEGNPKEPVSAISITFPNTDSMTTEVSALMGKTVLSQVLDELVRDNSLAGWVREGLPLHVGDKATGSCRFCGQVMPLDRIAKLQGHFNDQYNRFLVELDAKISWLETARRNMQLNLPAKAAFYEHLAAGYEEAALKITPQVKKRESYIGALIAALKEKRSKPFEEVDLKSLISSVEVPDITEGEALIAEANKFVAQHNTETGTFTSGIASARKELEECLVAESVDIFNSKLLGITNCDQAKKVIESAGAELAARVGVLEREVVEHRRPAEELNGELTSYLGRSELQFEIKENGYAILRNAMAAEHLSEGERTAIAFLYFLKSLQAKDFDLKKDIVVIDDPVSSLDANSLFCAFGFMKERTSEAGQLFVFTHNSTLFRQVKNWFNHAKNQKCKDPDKRPARFFMISASTENGGKRQAILTHLDPLLHEYESDYHFLFKKVYDHSQIHGNVTSLESFYGLPNIARRLLEAFLAFRYPVQTGELREQLNGVSFDAAKKARILRFLHTFSHEGKISEGEHDLSILAETPQVLRDVLDLIESEDSRHFSEMKSLALPKPITP